MTDYSLCIGAGIMTQDVLNTDIEGNPRPNPPGSSPDMGAYENSLGAPLTSIIVTSPNGGEAWCSGSHYAIQWMTTGVGIARVHLQYSTNGGVDYQDITTYPHLLNTGTYQWTVPQISSTTVLVKAIARDASDNPLADDVSNGNFTIQMPQIGVTPASLTFNAAAGGANPSSKTLNITNPGCGTLNWIATDDATWLSLSPASGDTTTETDEVTVSVDITGLTEGTYNADITITSTNASNSPRNLPVTLNLYTGGVLSISLYEGFNLFSIPFNLPNTTLSVVLADIFYSTQSVFVLRGGIWYGAAPDHDTGMWDDEIGTIDGGETFVIYMESDDTLHVTGTPLLQTTVTLNQGFNLVPYNSVSEKTVEEAFGGIRDYVQSIFVYDAASHLWLGCAPDDGGWDTEFDTLSPGVGIVIYCKADGVVWDVGQ